MPNLSPEQMKMLQQSFQGALGNPGMASAGQNLQNYLGNQPQPNPMPQQQMPNDQEILAKQMALRQLMAQQNPGQQ